MGQTGFAKMDLAIDNAWQYVQARGIDRGLGAPGTAQIA
jgi:hypothetical protein